MNMNNPSKLNSWKKIKNYSKLISRISLNKMFKDDSNRFNDFLSYPIPKVIIEEYIENMIQTLSLETDK